MVVGKGRTVLGDDGVAKPPKQHSEGKTLNSKREAHDSNRKRRAVNKLRRQ